jgi:predicted DNA-binding transcriptional regulator AlpA
MKRSSSTSNTQYADATPSPVDDTAAGGVVNAADQLLSEPTVLGLIGNVTRVTRWRWEQSHGFPQPIRIRRKTLWSLREVEAWIQARLDDRGKPARSRRSPSR